MDTDVLTGASPTPPPVVMGTFPPAQPAPAAPTPLDQTIASHPDSGPTGTAGAAPNMSTPPPAAGTPSVWKDVAMGAIYGLAGSAGAKHFGAGIGMGAEGVLNQQQLQKQNDVQQQQLQFESVKAADSHILAVAQAKEADMATEEHKVQLDAFKANVDAFNKAMGISPAITVKAGNPTDMNAQANGGLQTLASRNGGTIPEVVTVNSAAGEKNTNHTIDVYSKPTQQELQQNPNGYRKLVDTASLINNGSPATDEQWNTGNFAMKPGNAQQGMQMLGQKAEGQAQMVLAAQQRLYGVPSVTGNTAKDSATAATLQQQLDSYQKRADADPAATKLLQAQIEAFNSAAKDAKGKETKATTEATKAEMQAKLDTENSPANQQAAARGAGMKSSAEEQAKVAADTASGEWKPKVTADEKKKAELAENIAENATSVNGILARRPDLVGAVAGRFTNTKQMIGNNDPDISAVGNRIHNIAMANSGVHGFRSQEGVEETERNLLNNFKNGPQAVAGALSSNVDSVQTFIDNARPKGYQTHTSQGGAGVYYHNLSAAPQPIYAAAPGKPRVMSSDGGKTWQPAPQ